MDSSKIIREFMAIGNEEQKEFTPYTKQFKIELTPAKRAEKWAREVLEEDYGPVLWAEDDEVHYDLLIRRTGERVEVKYDKLSKKTNRVAVETESYGNRRGIERSTSNYYMFICYDKDWSEITNGIKKIGMWVGCLIKTDLLREMVHAKPYKEVQGGDNNATAMLIVPVEDIREASTRVYPIIK
jgi:hypothetical protein